MAAILQGRAAGADGFRKEHLARAGPHRQALSGEGPEQPLPVGEGRGVRAVGGVGPDHDGDERRARRSSAEVEPPKKWADRRGGPGRARGRGPSPLEAAEARRRVLGGGVKRVAVLPFENLGAPEDDYFADGIADQIRGKLTGAPGHRGHRARQLDAVQEDDQDAAGDRPGADAQLSADRHRTLAEERRRAAACRSALSSSRSGADAARLEVAAAFRRVAHGRLPGAVRHRDQGGAGAGRRARRASRKSGFRTSPRRTSPPTTPS